MLGIIQRAGAVGAVYAAVTETPSAAVFHRRAVQAGLRVVVITIVNIQVIYKSEKTSKVRGSLNAVIFKISAETKFLVSGYLVMMCKAQ